MPRRRSGRCWTSGASRFRLTARLFRTSLSAEPAPPRLCPICGTDNSAGPALTASQPPWLLKECGRCGFVYLENPPPAGDLADEFAWERTHAGRARAAAARAAAGGRESAAFGPPAARSPGTRRQDGPLDQRYVGSGRLLDVGCGHGLLLQVVPREVVPYGIEVSARLAAQSNPLAVERGGYVIEGPAATALSLFSGDFFAGIVMRCYLEHETEAAGCCAVARRILRPGGVLIVKVPNYDCWNRRWVRRDKWCGFRFPDHVNYFTPGSLVGLLVAQGFEIARFRPTDRLPTGDNMWLVARKPVG